MAASVAIVEGANDAFPQIADAFDNDDFVDVVIHSYRHRSGALAGDPAYASVEDRLAEQPALTPASIVLLGADDGVSPPPKQDPDARHFAGHYECRILPSVGHNAPQEAPAAFAEAILALA